MLGNTEVKVHSIRPSRHQGNRRQPQAELPSGRRCQRQKIPAPVWLGARAPAPHRRGETRLHPCPRALCWAHAGQVHKGGQRVSGGGGFPRNRSTSKSRPTPPSDPRTSGAFSWTQSPVPEGEGKPERLVIRKALPRRLQRSPVTNRGPPSHPTWLQGPEGGGTPGGGCPHPAIPFSP